MKELREKIAQSVRTYLDCRAAEMGMAADRLDASQDLFESRLLDSVALAGLIAAVEAAIELDIDFVRVDPAALSTMDSIVAELAQAVESERQP